ncbi:MAG TPA: chemotaxis protein CheW [Noviherbaspirillum sp.]|nr:chemotaxis protein CheW [Noviherbaspirillum sp.]
MTLVEFECRGQRFALPLHCVRRVVASAQPDVLPGAPDIVLGVLNVGGEIVTLIDFGRRIGGPATELNVAQRLLIIDIGGFAVAFVVDAVIGVSSREWEHLPGLPARLSGAEFVDAVVRLDDGLCIIVNPEKFLFEDERVLLGDALEKMRHEEH